MAGARHGWLPVTALLVAASFSHLLFQPLADAVEGRDAQRNTERISGSAGDVLEDNPVGKLKVFIYDLPSKYNKRLVTKDPRCLSHVCCRDIHAPFLALQCSEDG